MVRKYRNSEPISITRKKQLFAKRRRRSNRFWMKIKFYNGKKTV